MPLPSRNYLLLRTLLGAVVMAPLSAYASGQLDPSFGNDAGHVLLAFGSGASPSDQAYDLIVDSAGRIVGAGFETHGSSSAVDGDMVVFRLLPDGSLDSSFGIGGRRRIAFDVGGNLDAALSVIESPSGSYVVCGLAEDDEDIGGGGRIAIARLLGNGSFDTSFDLDGRRVFNVLFPGNFGINFPTRCDVMADGRIVFTSGVANINTGELFGVLGRLLPDGSADTSFNGTGSLLFTIGDQLPLLTLNSDVRALADGRILVAGRTIFDTNMAPNTDIFVARFTAAGALDSSFADSGVRAIAFDQGGSNNDVVSRLRVDPAGRIVAAGWAATATSSDDFAIARLLSNGQFDSSFGTGGRVIVGLDAGGTLSDQAHGLTVDASGRTYLAGQVDVAAGNRDAAVLRLTPSGAPDATYGVGGWHVFAIDTSPDRDSEGLRAVALDPSDRALAAGLAHIGPELGNYDVLVLRLNSETVFSNGFE